LIVGITILSDVFPDALSKNKIPNKFVDKILKDCPFEIFVDALFSERTLLHL
jgi:hypothetical protein